MYPLLFSIYCNNRFITVMIMVFVQVCKAIGKCTPFNAFVLSILFNKYKIEDYFKIKKTNTIRFGTRGF